MTHKLAWQVTYYYLATGMEGQADSRDYGTVWADTAREAKEIVAKRDQEANGYDDATKEWFKGCLTARTST